MTDNQIASEVRDLNLSYLLLAQALIRKDQETALFRLGISAATAEIISKLSGAQLRKIAGSSQLLCAMRFADDLVFGLILDHSQTSQLPENYALLHADIVRASQHAEAV